MIRSHFGIEKNPFNIDDIELLAHQQEIFDTLRVHCQQGGLCIIAGEPGVGKSIIKQKIKNHDLKRLIVPTVSRTMHTYSSTLSILCQAFNINTKGRDPKCEKDLIEEAHRLNKQGKMIAPIIDDAHLLNINCLRKLRLLFEDLPKNHNLILIGQPSLIREIKLSVNEDIKSRITYSVMLKPLNPDQVNEFILKQLDKCGLPHNVFSEDALQLIVRSSEGILRYIKHLCTSSLIEAIRDQQRSVTTDHINRVLMQPHWRKQEPLTR